MSEPVKVTVGRVKRGDVGVAIRATLEIDGAPVPGGISGAAVSFLMRRHGETGSPDVTGSATILDGTACTVEYETAAGDLDTVGIFDVEWEAVWGLSQRLTFPGAGYDVIEVVQDLNETP